MKSEEIQQKWAPVRKQIGALDEQIKKLKGISEAVGSLGEIVKQLVNIKTELDSLQQELERKPETDRPEARTDVDEPNADRSPANVVFAARVALLR